MKIIYYSHPCFADCDFPLIGELQRMGHDVRYYISIASYSKKSTLLNIEKLYPHTGIYPATDIYKEFLDYNQVLDFSKVHVVNQKHKQKYHPANLLLMIRLFFCFILQKPDVIHLTKQPYLAQKLLYFIKSKLVLTVHDPFLHFGMKSKKAERNRQEAFRKIPRLVLLNDKQSSAFASHYEIPSSHIFINKLGVYNSMLHVDPAPAHVDAPFILFFGQIIEYKGVEFLLEAMKIVHQQHPEVKLVVAGGGKYYFDIESYKNLSYIDIRNHYIGVPELAGLLKACLFSVCPYKDATQSGVIQTAFAFDVPMIVTDVGALSQSVQHGKTGLVIPPCDSHALADAMNYLVSNPTILNEMRDVIHNDWLKEMDWTPIAEKYVECYNMKVES